MTKCELCNRKVCGYRITSIGERTRNVPMDEKKYTGSDKYCEKHQYNEPWWPKCSKCSKKAIKGSFCYECTTSTNVFSQVQSDTIDDGWTTV